MGDTVSKERFVSFNAPTVGRRVGSLARKFPLFAPLEEVPERLLTSPSHQKRGNKSQTTSAVNAMHSCADCRDRHWGQMCLLKLVWVEVLHLHHCTTRHASCALCFPLCSYLRARQKNGPSRLATPTTRLKNKTIMPPFGSLDLQMKGYPLGVRCGGCRSKLSHTFATTRCNCMPREAIKSELKVNEFVGTRQWGQRMATTVHGGCVWWVAIEPSINFIRSHVEASGRRLKANVE